MGSKQATVYLPEPILRVIEKTERNGLSGRLADIVERYGLIVELERRALESLFSETELNALTDAIWNTALGKGAVILGAVLAAFADSRHDGLYDRWGVDAPEVIRKLKGLSVGQEIALVELLERRRRSLGREEERFPPATTAGTRTCECGL